MNPQMLTLLRESRGMSGTRLAAASGVPQSTISKMENAISPMDPERMRAIAEALDYPIEAFSWTDTVYGFGAASFYHRKQQALPVTKLREIQANVNLLRMRLSRLLKGAEVESRFTVPSISSDELDGGPAEIARAVRALWMLPMGPIQNMTTALEQAGVIVMYANLGSPKIAAITLKGIDGPPTIVMNTGMPADRERFTLAHELGHLVMHSGGDIVEDGEGEADKFAAELLMPAAEIRTQLREIDLARAIQLKLIWRVAISALIRRARDLGQIDDRRYTSLNVMRSQRGWAKNEPGVFDHERPTVIKALLNLHLDEHGYTVNQLASTLGLHEEEFHALYDVEDRWRRRKRHLALA